MTAGAGRYRPGPAGLSVAIRTALFYVWIALVTLVMGVAWLPVVLLRADAAHRLGVAWTGQILLAARLLLGLRFEVRGTPPTDDCIIASKHQSFLDILIIANSVPQCAFIMKRQLLLVPIMGYFARKAGCIPIDRSRGAEAFRKIAEEIAIARTRPEGLGQLIIYPEGTRTKPGEKRKYKHGVASIQQATGLRIVPVGVNCGMFWPKRGYPIRSGVTVVEFLPEIPPGLPHQQVMPELAQRIEGSSDALLALAQGPGEMGGGKVDKGRADN